TALSNQSLRFNPFHQLEVETDETPGDPAGLVDMLGTGAFVPASDWPDHLVGLNAAAVDLLADATVTKHNALAWLQDQGGVLLICDRLFVHHSGCELLTRTRL